MAEQNLSNDDKLFGAISYISIISVFMYLVKKNNPFILFHARQGIVLFIASLLWFIPVLGWIIAALAYLFMVVGFIQAYSGNKMRIPIVANLAEKITF